MVIAGLNTDGHRRGVQLNAPKAPTDEAWSMNGPTPVNDAAWSMIAPTVMTDEACSLNAPPQA
jgi:hypothetical protein